MIIIFAIALQAATQIPAATCNATADIQSRLATDIQQEPTPLGMSFGVGDDLGDSKILLVETTHRLGVPLIEGSVGTEKATYFVQYREKTCEKVIDRSSCPSLGVVLDSLKHRTYPLMVNSEALRQSFAFHPTGGFLKVKDGDGNLTSISIRWYGHPAAVDLMNAFKALSECTKDVDHAAHEF